MNLEQWAIKWGVSFDAIEDLRREFGMINTDPTPTDKTLFSESAVQSKVRLEASKKGLRLWRNNVGAGYMEDGSFMRWGLCNDSKRVNQRIKSGDLIGIRKRLIMPDDVGQIIGQFVSREIKKEGWHYTGAEGEEQQLRFAELVNSYGGDAAFATGEGSL